MKKVLALMTVLLFLSAPNAYSQICNGDFDCDNDCDGTDAVNFKKSFWRNNCPDCLPFEDCQSWINEHINEICCPPAPIPQTGQTISYRTGDDGYYEKGVEWPNPRFTNNEDGTVTDNLTGLMWMKDIALLGEMNWENAVDTCYNLDYGGYQDWRLPNLKALGSLTDYSQSDPRIPAGNPFIGYAGDHDWCWSSTGFSSRAQVFSLGAGDVGGSGKSYAHNCWCVRSGTSVIITTTVPPTTTTSSIP